jgi:hypothetical protein
MSFKKGHTPWNKNTKGLQVAWNKGKPFLRGKDNPMYGVHRFGKNAPFWNGGRRKDKYGYILIYKPEHPFCNCDGYIYEHRLVMEKIIRHYLKKEERVHHKNDIRNDNRPDNLTIFKNSGYHMSYHLSQNK